MDDGRHGARLIPLDSNAPGCRSGSLRRRIRPLVCGSAEVARCSSDSAGERDGRCSREHPILVDGRRSVREDVGWKKAGMTGRGRAVGV